MSAIVNQINVNAIEKINQQNFSKNNLITKAYFFNPLSFFQNKRFLSDISLSNWNIVEQPHYVEKGKTHIEDSKIRFFDSIENCLKKIVTATCDTH